MKADKRAKRSALKKKQRTKQKQQQKAAQARAIHEQVERMMAGIDTTEESMPDSARDSEKRSPKLLWYIGVCKESNAFPPWVMGQLLGSIHWSKVNAMLEEIGVQHPKENGKRRVPTEAGEGYFACPSTSGLKWKLSAVKLLADRYDLPFQMPSAEAIWAANVEVSGSIRTYNESK